MSVAPMTVEVFCCYAHEDEFWLRKLETHLSLLKRQGLISLWHDRLTSPGTDWAQAIDTYLETASVILLLVSADFIASDYCYGIEMKRALERQEAGEARVIPILVRPADWKNAPFAYLQALPTDAKPITSWRNKDTALATIAGGLRRVIEDLPLLAASAPRVSLPAVWNIPYSRNPFFLGRDEEMAQLRHSLYVGQATALSQPQAISGLGGIGKTQLALEYAYRYHQEYQAVLWAHAESTETLISSYLTFASLLRLPEREAKEQEVIVQAVKTWLQTHREWLLILDNADDLALLSDFLPPSLGGHLLLTTRAAAIGRLAHRMEIETLPPEQGTLFLLRRAALLAPDATLEQASQEEQELALQISQELGELPLALDQAGAYLEETRTDLASYWHIYQQHRPDLLYQRGGLVPDHPAPVATTWVLSFQKVEEKQPAAAELLRMAAYLAPDAIPEEILTAGASFLGPVLSPIAADAFLLGRTIEVLRAYSLVRRDPREKTLSIHRLVQVILQDQMSDEIARLWIERVVKAINCIFPKDIANYTTWPNSQRYIIHVLACAKLVERWNIVSTDTADLLERAAYYLDLRTQYIEAEGLYRQALQISELISGIESPKAANIIRCLGIIYAAQGKYTQAELYYQQAIAIQEKIGELKGKSLTLNNLGVLYIDIGRYTQAEHLFQRLLDIRSSIYEQESFGIAQVLGNLGVVYELQGKYTQAEPLYLRSLAIREKIVGQDNPRISTDLGRLASLKRHQGNYAEAEKLYKRCLKMTEKVWGPEHPQVTSPLTGLASLYREQGNYAQAEPLYQRALHIQEQRLGAQHPETAETILNVALFQETLGNHQEALSLYQRAFMILQQAFGQEHPKTRATHQRLTALLHSLNQEAPDLQEHSPPERREQNT